MVQPMIQVKKNLNKPPFALMLLLLLALLPFSLAAQEKNSRHSEKIMLNIAADAIAIWPSWRKDIDSLKRPEIVQTLRNYIDEYAGSQITTLFFNVNYQRAAYSSKIMTPYWDLPPGIKTNDWASFHAKLHRKKVDPYSVGIKRAREKKISPWLSIRMNDHHYWNDSTKLSRFVLDNPQHRLYEHAFLNYGKKEVRDYFLAFINEALDRYDVDGIELDWIRTNTLFKDGTKEEWIAITNDFMKQVRALVNQKAAKRKHPIKIATRVLISPDITESYGLDGVAWVQNGWTDILIPGNWHNPVYFDIPLEEWRKRIGPGHNYLLIPSADMWYSMQKDPYSKIMRVDIETMRAFAVGTYSRGGDGIYLFNHFNSKDYVRKEVNSAGEFTILNDRAAVFAEIGSASTLQLAPRRHPLTYPDPAGRSKKIETVFPAEITPVAKIFQVYTGPKLGTGTYTLILGFEMAEGLSNADLLVEVNGVSATQLPDPVKDKNYVYTKTKKWEQVGNLSEVGARVMAFRLPVSAIESGYTTIRVTNKTNQKQVANWLEIKID
jgi:uncharacterized lipoprotein YddW (UPF0748 family)